MQKDYIQKIVIFLSVAVIVIFVTALFVVFGVGSGSGVREEIKQSKVIEVSLTTAKGEMVLELRHDLMPRTVENFVKLVESGFYKGTVFFRADDWVIQGGDPNGNGTGGPGWKIKFENNPELKCDRYAVVMARQRDDKNSAGSQFFITKLPDHELDGKYAVFGKVIKGQDVVDSTQVGDAVIDAKVTKIK